MSTTVLSNTLRLFDCVDPTSENLRRCVDIAKFTPHAHHTDSNNRNGTDSNNQKGTYCNQQIINPR